VSIIIGNLGEAYVLIETDVGSAFPAAYQSVYIYLCRPQQWK
jgi:hypothetical protein